MTANRTRCRAAGAHILSAGLLAFTSLVHVPAAASNDESKAPAGPVVYEKLRGEVVLNNERVLVQRFVLAHGTSTGRHEHAAAQLLVFVRGGVLKSAATGRETLWRDGRVVWQVQDAASDEGIENVGTAEIEMLWVTLKPVPATATASPASTGERDNPYAGYLNYPNIPGEDLLENDRVIVQRFTVYPGQWEGVHEHRGNMFYIHIKGGFWADRTYTQPLRAFPVDPDGEVGWEPRIDIGEGHQSGNVGREPIDLIWVSLKR